ncbi:homer protein homolog 2-like isoform X2 [Acanthaster planci]|uniref:Homer protein homolog 2-like isoform X2 n=1 Tax=Acanthaster planci TaxID=133434 RepID=A0A8B7YVQ1_ACAPL|nr:homer protein homolog 2-like isoform X2 [Acanthaster planci]XP_022097381.1 homer protein homolog 2-like isoform X2 [Acanthaster planci]XP_022097382.1 homer protein homolog 2-like isoform X2 [Acanthaster planci]XP_022097383.1 homer protein homolog 2-like isoform X2 [Acanthaster planci]
MGEQPIFNTRAHVFQIDPVTKKNWLPSSKQAVNVSFFYDSTRSSYRIISVDGSKAIINSTMVPQMTFTKTSQKFGQWADNRANTVYGLGFSSEAELNKFIEQFDSIKEKMKATTQDKKGGGDSGITANGTARASVVTTGDQPLIKHTKERSADNTPISAAPANTSNDAQVRYENDRLKIALAQSSNNAKKWELELQTLKNNNARLTTALQESTANVEEWKKQLSAYKEENARLKQKLQEAPQAGQGAPGVTKDSQDTRVKELEDKVQSLTRGLDMKTMESEELTKRLQEVLEMEEEGRKLRQELQDSKEAQSTLEKRVEELQDRLSREQSGRQHDTHRAQQLHSQLGNLIQDLSGLHQDMAEIL